MSFLLGLTGSIGMGKSTTAQMFADLNCDVWDADAAVHRMYSLGGAAVYPIGEKFPESIQNETVSRDVLKRIISQNPAALRQIEVIVHPLVAIDRAEFLKSATSDILVFDIPLLFEGGGNKMMDAVVCVSVSPETQENRVMERGTMSQDQFEMILSKQMPVAEKLALSDYVVETDTIDHARSQVIEIVSAIRERIENARNCS